MTTRRARSETAKAARRDEIIAVTSAQLGARGIYALSMQDIAIACNLTKPALYNYFPNREALFLVIYQKLVQRWLADFNRSLMAASHPLPRDGFNRLFVESFAMQPLLRHLTNHLTATMAPKLNPAAFAGLTADTSDQLAGLATLLVHYGYVDKSGAEDLSWAYYTIVTGAAQIADQPDGVADTGTPPISVPERASFVANCLATLACLR
ncbi:TetR/AcrR family transcriptional regulator [Alphaproteobacteria bacterium LSUCC0719]|jgi:AcrR family transcriptional regulator